MQLPQHRIGYDQFAVRGQLLRRQH